MTEPSPDPLLKIERLWSAFAPSFDDDPDHGLREPAVRRAWATQLERWLPPAPRLVADLGCGTGSLSLLLAEQGHTVIGLDLTSEMIAHARRKAATQAQSVAFAVADVTDPPLKPNSVDVLLCRHVVWTLPDPVRALQRWSRLLRPDGRLVTIEGRWFEPTSTGTSGAPPWDGGVVAAELAAALEPLFEQIDHEPLSAREDLWGRSVEDERYAIIASDSR